MFLQVTETVQPYPMSYIPFLYMNDVLRLSVYCRCCCCCCCTVRPGCHSNRQYYSQLLFLDSNIYNNQAHYRFNRLNLLLHNKTLLYSIKPIMNKPKP